MSGQAVRVGGAALALLAAVALAAGAVALLTRGDDAAQVRIVAPEPTAAADSRRDGHPGAGQRRGYVARHVCDEQRRPGDGRHRGRRRR